ncbi:MAG: SagB/ThcOx family dehydrogenase [Anaerolineaceae bacterium]|nr:SagB/ThcOx family dehydrogenase [Anaerolineaceae bacterium]
MSENIGNEFMRRTRPSTLRLSPQQRAIPQPPIQLAYPPDASLIELPKPTDLKMPSIDLRTAIEQRISVRRYSKKLLTLEEFSFLLWATQGVKPIKPRPVTRRNVPSAGARHAFETYLLLNRVEGLMPGLYRFLALQHALIEENLTADIGAEISKACFDQKMILNCAAVFIWAGVVERMTWRYVDRGYRYLHLDAGHVCQNLYLAGEGLDCGTCAIGAFDDVTLNRTIGLDGEKLLVIYLACVGKKIEK